MQKWIEDKVDRVVEWFWRWLPDRCQIEGCERHGVRGQETTIMYHGKPTRACDDCRFKIQRDREQRAAEKDRLASIHRRWP